MLKFMEKNQKKQRIEEARNVMAMSMIKNGQEISLNSKDEFLFTLHNLPNTQTNDPTLIELLRRQNNQSFSTMQNEQEQQRIERRNAYENKKRIFGECFPELMENRGFHTAIKYPIEDRLILKVPELHGHIYPQKPTPKAILASNDEFEKLLYIWEFCNNFHDLLGTDKFKIEELRIALRWGSVDDKAQEDNFNIQPIIIKFMKSKLFENQDQKNQHVQKQLQEVGFNMLNKLMSALIECLMKDQPESKNGEEITINNQHFQTEQESLDIIISTIAMTIQEREKVWPEIARLLLIQQDEFENFGEHEEVMQNILKKMINMEPCQFNSFFTYYEKLIFMTVLIDTVHNQDSFRAALNNRLDMAQQLKKDKMEINYALKDADLAIFRLLGDQQDPQFQEEQNILNQKLQNLRENFTNQQQEDSKLLQDEIQELQEQIETPVRQRELIEKQRQEVRQAFNVIAERLTEAELKSKLIGRDALRQEYWFFKDDPHRVYIRREELLANFNLQQKQITDESNFQEFKNLLSQESAQPQKQVFSWFYYDTFDELNQLTDNCLNVKGIRERQLVSSIKLNMDKFKLKGKSNLHLNLNGPNESVIDDCEESQQIQEELVEKEIQHIMFATDDIESCFNRVLLFNNDEPKFDKISIDHIKNISSQIEILYTENSRSFRREWASSESRQDWKLALKQSDSCENLCLLAQQLDNGMNSPTINQDEEEVAFTKAQLNFKLMHFKFWPSQDLHICWREYLTGQQVADDDEENNENKSKQKGWLSGSPSNGNLNALFILVSVLLKITQQFIERENIKKEKKERKEIKETLSKTNEIKEKVVPLSDTRTTRNNNLQYFQSKQNEYGLSKSCSVSSKSDIKSVKQDHSEKQDNCQSKDSSYLTEKENSSYISSKHDLYCYICNDGGELLICEDCPKVAHQECLKIDTVPDLWFCTDCDKNKKKDIFKITKVKKQKQDKTKQSQDKQLKKEESWDERCMVCRKGGVIISCNQCENVIHEACSDKNILNPSKWYCKECQQHNGIKQSEESESESNTLQKEWLQWCMYCDDGGELMCCEGCKNVAHEDCASQSLESDEDWYCKKCQNNLREPPKKKKANFGIIWDEECMICQKDGDVLQCETCTNVAHKGCLRVKIRNGQFQCSTCYSKKIKKKAAQKSSQKNSDSDREWNEFCIICQDGGNVMCCDGCPNVAHEKCLGQKIGKNEDWNCPKCLKTLKKNMEKKKNQDSNSDKEWSENCMICNDGGNVICCDGCQNVVHRACISIKVQSQDDWFCDECVLALAKKISHPRKSKNSLKKSESVDKDSKSNKQTAKKKVEKQSRSKNSSFKAKKNDLSDVNVKSEKKKSQLVKKKKKNI